MTDLKQLVADAGEHARDVLITRGWASLMPMYHIIVEPPAQDLIIGCPWNGEQEKLATFAAVKRIAHERRAVAVLFVSEVWVRVVPKPLTPWHAARLDLTTPPSESPDRQECVFAVATDGIETKAGRWQIVRDRPGGVIIALVEEKGLEGSFEGRLLDGLVPRRL